jgi:hypothetical protein
MVIRPLQRFDSIFAMAAAPRILIGSRRRVNGKRPRSGMTERGRGHFVFNWLPVRVRAPASLEQALSRWAGYFPAGRHA